MSVAAWGSRKKPKDIKDVPGPEPGLRCAACELLNWFVKLVHYNCLGIFLRCRNRKESKGRKYTKIQYSIPCRQYQGMWLTIQCQGKCPSKQSSRTSRQPQHVSMVNCEGNPQWKYRKDMALLVSKTEEIGIKAVDKYCSRTCKWSFAIQSAMRSAWISEVCVISISILGCWSLSRSR